MAGGDLRILNENVGGLGQAQAMQAIDAHSVQSGDFTEERTVTGGVVFLTPEGAAAYDGLRNAEYTFVVERDPKGFMLWLLGDRVGKSEKFQGSPEETP